MNSSGESAAREQWMLDAAEEIADAFIDDGLKEATATVSADIIARHYAAREREVQALVKAAEFALLGMAAGAHQIEGLKAAKQLRAALRSQRRNRPHGGTRRTA